MESMDKDDLPKTIEVDLGTNIVFLDLTTLFSNYQCIYGKGCKGTCHPSDPDPDPVNGNDDWTVGCCHTGPISENIDLEAKMGEYVEGLEPHQAENYDLIQSRGWLNYPRSDARARTWRVKTTAKKCIFLNSGEFDRPGCAMYLYALDNGLDPTDTRPDACSLQPILTHKGSRNGRETWRVGIRRASDPSWFSKRGYWCTRDPNAFTADEPTFRVFEKEMRIALYTDWEHEVVMGILEDEWQKHSDLYKELYWNKPAEAMPDGSYLGMPSMPS